MTGFIAIAPVLLCCLLTLAALVAIVSTLADMRALFERIADQHDMRTAPVVVASDPARLDPTRCDSVAHDPSAEVIDLHTRRALRKAITPLRAAA